MYVAACEARHLPAIITTAVKRCADHYWMRGGRLQRLRYGESVRRKRTERRCAQVGVLMYLLTRVNLATLQCVTPTPAGLKPIAVDTIAVATGLSRRRTERTLADLSRAGYLRTQPRHDKVIQADGTIEIVNQVAVRWLTPLLFADLGLGPKLDRERLRARRRHRAAQTAAAAVQPGGRALDLLSEMARAGRSRTKRPSSSTGPDVDPLEIEAKRLIGVVKANHPDWTHEACLAEAWRRVRSVAPKR
uniref:hypothetical protein n=1 Tax=Burkholderia diffusa TaxID=488732 RepID=UPI001CC3FBE1|nr:hypothetical protein [Burkholderia diffusa]